MNTENRIAEAKKFFDLLFGAVNQQKFGYLWTKQDNTSKTYPFDVSSDEARAQMARKAIELNDAGTDVYFGVNLGDNPPDTYKRFTAAQVTMQTATVTDIDIEGGKHISTPQKVYPPNFDTAKSFLPFDASLLVNSGYGLHGYLIYSEPIRITDDNRADAESRDRKFIEAVRANAGLYSKTVDGVGDLARVLRVPGTFNYKCGRDNAPLCRLVEVNDTRFTLNDMDARLRALVPDKTKSEPPRKNYEPSGDEPSDLERLQAMLDVIPCAEMTYDEWIRVGMAIKREGGDVSMWERWSRDDPRFKDGECERKWQGFNRNSVTIATVHEIAQRYGYSQKDFFRDWYKQHPDKSTPRRRTAPPDDLPPDFMPCDVPDDVPQYKSIAEIRDACEWNGNFEKGEDGKRVFRRKSIKATQANLDLIFENDPNLRGLVGYDEFQEMKVLLKPAPWNSKAKAGKGKEWGDADDAELRGYIRRNYAELKDKQGIEDTVVHFANRNAFHPVKNFFANLPAWDGVGRAETLFIKFLRVDDTPYAREVTMNWLTAAVARIFNPGCTYHTALVLQGAQGIGKSYLIERLGGEWYLELIESVDDTHASDAIQRGWLVEMKEMAATRKAEINNVKAFIERSFETRRRVYEKHATTSYRHCVFAVTCNDDEFLKDPTGNRRYLILHCNSQMFGYVEGLTDEYIQQIWAEVYHRYCELFKEGFDEEKLSLSREHKIEAETVAAKYVQDDGLTTEIKGYLDTKIPPQVIWQVLTREERRKFIADGNIKFVKGFDELKARIKARGRGTRDVEIEKLQTIFASETVRDSGDLSIIYGSEYRQHICAAEIFNECFGSDNRKKMFRINEILSTLEGWHLGERLRNANPAYPDQKKPYYRDAENIPTDAPAAMPTTANFQGEPIDPKDTPF